MEFCKFINAASLLQEAKLTIRPIYQTNESLSAEQIQELCKFEAAVQTANPQVIFDCLAAGLTDLYFDCGDSNEKTLSALHGKCRYVADSKADVKVLDHIVASFLKQGYLETIAIHLKESSEETAFTPKNVETFSRWIRFSQNLAVRGIFVDVQENWAENAKQSFSLIKKIRSDMPCLFSYFCFDGLLTPLAEGNEELLQTLKMLASLNDTSLYACFYIK